MTSITKMVEGDFGQNMEPKLHGNQGKKGAVLEIIIELCFNSSYSSSV